MNYRLSSPLLLASLPLLLACSAKITSGATLSGAGGSSTASQGSGPTMSAVSGSGSGADTAVGNATSTGSGVGGAASGPTSTGTGVGGTASGPATVGAGVGGGAPVDCSPSKLAAVWSAMVQAPIMLPGKAGQLDLAGPKGMGLSLLQAESIDCQCAAMLGGTGGSGAGGSGAGGGNTGGPWGDGTDVCAFGDNQEVWFTYTPSNDIGTILTVWPGYAGALAAKSRDGAHTYGFSVLTAPVQKDGLSFNLDWNLAGFNQNPAFDAEINELYDALIATYAPSLPVDTDCQSSGNCVVGSFGDVAYMYFPQVGAAFWIASLSAGQPTCSTFNRIDLYAKGP